MRRTCIESTSSGVGQTRESAPGVIALPTPSTWSGIQGDGAGLYAPWRRGPQALQGDEAMAQRSRRYARLCERRLAAPLMLDAYYSGTIVEYYFSKLFIISVLSSFSRLLCVIVRSL